MPIYEYQCGACHHKFESIQRMNDKPLKVCPECNKNKLQKLVSAAGFHLKGGGWYATDYTNKGKQKENKESKEGNVTQESSDQKNKSGTQENKKTETPVKKTSSKESKA